MRGAVCVAVISVCLVASLLPAQEKKVTPELEAFADKLIAASSTDEQTRLLDDNKPLFTPDFIELLHQRGTVFFNKRDFTNVLKYDQARLLAANRLGDRELMAEAALGLATMYNAGGEFQLSIAQFDVALAIFRELNNEPEVAEKAVSELYLGNLELAGTLHEQAGALYEKLNDKTGVARTMLNLGNVYHRQGNNRDAITAYLRSLELSRELNIDKGISFSTNNLGSVYYDQGEYELALKFFEESLAIKRKLGNPLDIISSLVNMAATNQDLKRFDESKKALDEALSLARPDDPRARVTVLNRSARLLIAQEKYADALPQLEEALRILDTVEDRLLKVDTLIRLSGVETELKRPSEGIQAADAAAEIAARVQAPYFVGLAMEMHGHAARALGDDEDALKGFQQSLSVYEELRENVAGGPQQQQEFLNTAGDESQEVVDILVSHKRYEDAFQMAEREKAQVLLSVLGSDAQALSKHMTADEKKSEVDLQSQISHWNSELSQVENDPRIDPQKVSELRASVQKARLDFEGFETTLYAAHPELQIHRSQVKAVSSAQTAGFLHGSQTVVLEYVVGLSKSFLFVVGRDAAGKSQLRVHTLNVSKSDLTQRIAAFRQKIATRDLDFRDDASELYKILIAPAASDLAGKQTVVIIPDGSLWQLPFQVLQNSSGRYLLENYALFFAPSATVLSQSVGQSAKSVQDPSLLAIGDVDVGRQLAGVYGTTHTRVVPVMDSAEISAQSGEYSVIHFAAHGFYGDRHPLYSYLQTSTRDDSRLEARQMMALDLKAAVVVLSACETARGGTSGDGLMGMTWALSIAGVPTTVASQWKVDSASTTELMVDFHRALIAGMTGKPASKAKALQQAALAIMKKPEYRHPFYWSGFVMVGNGF